MVQRHVTFVIKTDFFFFEGFRFPLMSCTVIRDFLLSKKPIYVFKNDHKALE